MVKEKGMIQITEDGLITQIREIYPEIEREDIEITERCLDNEGGVKIFFEVETEESAK